MHACIYGQYDITYDEYEEIMEHTFITNKAHRSVKYQYTRIDWDKHLKQLRHTYTFQSRMHMKEESFDKLVL